VKNVPLENLIRSQQKKPFARDVADDVLIDYEPLPAAIDTVGAAQKGAPLVWDDVPGNICFDAAKGDEVATKKAFEEAAHTVVVDLVNNRLVSNSMEGRVALAEYDAERDHYTVTVTSQGAHNIRARLEQVLKHPADKITVLTHDVGGGFGTKIFVYPEYALVAWAAKKLGQPIKWTSDRSHAFLTDVHGRDNVTRGELALDASGKILALRASTYANMGAYLSNFATLIPAPSGMFTGVYDIPTAYINVKAVFTNTVPVDAYRGAGRPEASYLVERLADAAARQLGLSPAEFRRRNFIAPEAMPYTNALDLAFDSGEFARNMDQATQTADWAGFAKRRDESKARGKLRGLGMSYYVEICAFPGSEVARMDLSADGVEIWVGTQSNGQGHETSFAQVAAEQLGVPFETIRVRYGDTREIPTGGGTGGSRSMTLAGHAIADAAEKAIAKARPLAEDLLETASSDIEFQEGYFVVSGTDRRIGLLEVAAEAAKRGEPLAVAGKRQQPNATFPNGCHICEVEIDPETGVLEVLRHVVVDDYGRVVNPLLLAGQVHGGIAQGLGQALVEQAIFDNDSGQLITGSFMDYAIPRATLFPMFEFASNEILCRTNPMGMKGAGEAGTIGAPSAVVSAVIDALSGYGVRSIDMPVTAEKIWRLIHRAKAA
ncbi:MAG: molybdopterin-dependent oxidoreductase, partial [Proteobacteria bacterium]|nr:molybdopterin-dependent oxidoreductase [Pseudomonadota bacterium]